MINFETANECELKTRTIGDRTFHALKAANTDWDTDIEIGIPDNVLVDWFEERCKNLDLPSPKELEIENEELRKSFEASEETVGILADKIREMQDTENTLRDQIADLKVGRGR